LIICWEQRRSTQSISTHSYPYFPTCEIVTIGSELLLGQILDTNTTYLARELGRAGVTICFRTAVGDHINEICQVLQASLARCDLVVTTGGLGPTLDDLTREAVARTAGVALEFKKDLLEQIEHLFQRYGYDMPENNRNQAFVPTGSLAISNPVGTAPAFITEINGKHIVCLPGVPSELNYLMGREIIPWIRKKFNLLNHRIVYNVLKVVGLSESKVDVLIGDLIKPGENPEVGILASAGEIKVRVAATVRDQKEAQALIEPVCQKIRSRLGSKIYGQDDDTLEGVIDAMLFEKGFSLALIESFSGGIAAQKFYRLPSTQVVHSQVIPDEKCLAEYLARDNFEIREQLAVELARKVLYTSKADIVLAILGFAKKGEEGYQVKADTAVAGKGLQKTFSWVMGGSLAAIQERGAVIGTNTLRLALEAFNL